MLKKGLGKYLMDINLEKEKKVKVAFVVLGSAYSGAEVVLNRYLQENESIEPYFILIYSNNDIHKKMKELYGDNRIYSLGFTYSQLNITYLPFFERIKIKNKVKQVIKEISPDLIYLNNTTETMLVAGVFKNTPQICHIHDMKSHSRSPIRIFSTIKGIKKCSKAITVSHACQRDWNLDMSVIYNGIDKSLFKYKTINRIRNIGFVGGLSYRKGIDIVLDSLDDIMAQNKDIIFNFAFNSIENEMYLSQLKKLQIKYKNKINLFQCLDEEKIVSFYDKMDLIVVPSRHDPLPTVIMEAISRGVAVIGTKVDGIPELLNNEEYILMDKNNIGLSNKIDFIAKLDNEELNKLTLKLFECSKERFNTENKKILVNKIIKEVTQK